jgi:hypothetical protein
MFFSMNFKRVFSIIKFAFELGVIVVFLYLLVSKWGDVSALLLEGNYYVLLLVSIMLAGAHLLAPLAAKHILNIVNVNASYSFLLRIHLARLPAKYVPGGVWHTVGRAVDLLHLGIAKEKVVRLFFYENAFAVIVAAFLGGFLYFCAYFEVMRFVVPCFFTILLAVLLLIRQMQWKVPRKMRLFVFCFFIYVCAWFCLALGFALYVWSFISHDLVDITLVISSYLLAWVAGMLAVFSPQGMGVFEYVFSSLLWGADYSVSILVVLGAYRILVFVVDGIIWMLFKLSVCNYKFGSDI